MMLRLAILSAFCALSLLYALTPISEVEIPRTAYKSPYKFYLLEKTKKINTYEATYNSTFAHKTKLFFGVSTDNSDKVLQFF